MCEAGKNLQERPYSISPRVRTSDGTRCTLVKRQWGSPESIVNRAYYSVFYATLALLVTADVEPSKHSGVLAKFDELFIRQGIFPKEMSRILHHAFDMRQAGDYQKSRVITEQQAAEVLASAEEFVRTIQEKLS